MHLRLITYLAPSLPRALYECLCRHLSATLGVTTSLVCESMRSGPSGPDNPFSRFEVDLGFMCAPCFLGMRELDPAPVSLLAAAPLYDDPRNEGRPVYFSDVIVRRAAPLLRFDDLAGARWAYNDAMSLSGYHSVWRHLRERGLERSFLGQAVAVGSHLRAIEAVAAAAVEFAAIDSNTLRSENRQDNPVLANLRTIAALGPHPVQPVVISTSVDDSLARAIRDALLEAHQDETTAAELRRFGVLRFVPVSTSDYTRQTVFGPNGASADSTPTNRPIG